MKILLFISVLSTILGLLSLFLEAVTQSKYNLFMYLIPFFIGSAIVFMGILLLTATITL